MKYLITIGLPILAIKGSDFLGEKINPPGLAWTLGGSFAAICILLCVWLVCRILKLDRQPSYRSRP